MKHFLSFCFCLFMVSKASFSQISGEAFYRTKIDVGKSHPRPPRGPMDDSKPLLMEFGSVLIFDQDEAIYRYLKTKNTTEFSDSHEDRRKQFMMKRLAPENDVIYTNTESGRVVSQKEFMDKLFLIETSISTDKWKMTGETKLVSGMNCIKAAYISDTTDASDFQNTFVWFAPELPIAAGPAGFGGLPGLILYINVNDGEREISLDQIIFKPIDKKELKEPKKGKKVTKEAFASIVRKKREEQRQHLQDRRNQGGPPPHH